MPDGRDYTPDREAAVKEPAADIDAGELDSRAQDIVIEELRGGLPRLPEKTTFAEVQQAISLRAPDTLVEQVEVI